MTSLFLVTMNDNDGENQDLIVEAHKGDEAINMAVKYRKSDEITVELPFKAFVLPQLLGRSAIRNWNLSKERVK